MKSILVLIRLYAGLRRSRKGQPTEVATLKFNFIWNTADKTMETRGGICAYQSGFPLVSVHTLQEDDFQNSQHNGR